LLRDACTFTGALDSLPPKPPPNPGQKVAESITQVLHIIRFPVPDMVDAIQGSLRALLGMQKDKAGIFEGAPMTIQISFGRMVNNVLGCGSLDAGGDSVNCAQGYSPKKTIRPPIDLLAVLQARQLADRLCASASERIPPRRSQMPYQADAREGEGRCQPCPGIHGRQLDSLVLTFHRQLFWSPRQAIRFGAVPKELTPFAHVIQRTRQHQCLDMLTVEAGSLDQVGQ